MKEHTPSSFTKGQLRRWEVYGFGGKIADGRFDTWAWEAHYSRKLWDSIEARIAPLEPDLDGTRKSEVMWLGWPNGGVGKNAKWRGWEPEVGSEEIIGFLAAVAVKETESVIDVSDLDYTIRSHMLLGVMRAAFEPAGAEQRERQVNDLKRKIVEAGRIDDESKAEQWIQNALTIMEPYVQQKFTNENEIEIENAQWPAAVEDRSELLGRILTENGQLFARWPLSRHSKEFSFELKPREREQEREQ